MNVVDVGILVIVGLLAVGGLRRGFLLGVVDLLAFGLALVVAARAAEIIARPLRNWGIAEPLASGAGFVIIAVASLAIIGLAGRILLSPLGMFAAGTPLGWANSVLGLLPGAVRGLAVAALLLMLLAALPAEFGLRGQLAASRLAEPVTRTTSEALEAGLAWAGIDPGGLRAFFQAPGPGNRLPRDRIATRIGAGSNGMLAESPAWHVESAWHFGR
jgi:uncharacterized membrane protein required for colicin V production